MQLNCGFNLLKARMDRVISMLERMAVKVTFASDVQKLDCDGWFWVLLIFDAAPLISVPIQDQPGATSLDVSPDKAADEVQSMADVAMTG